MKEEAMGKKISVVLPVLLGDDPWMLELTKFVIKTMRMKTALPYELVVVETGSKKLEPLSWSSLGDLKMRVDKYLHEPERTTGVRDHNLGVRAATGDLIAFTANDIVVTDGWLEAMVECFDAYPDCGLASVAAAEPGSLIGPAERMPLIVEGSYTPIMMFRRGWELDEAYPGGYSDSDLIMRVYAAGLRAYRHCGARVFHLNHLTVSANAERARADIALGEELFYKRWGNSPLMMYAVIRSGGVAYGREHEFLRRPMVPYLQRVKEGV